MTEVPAKLARTILAEARADGRPALNESEAKRVLSAFGIAVPNGRLLPPALAPGFASGLVPPLALKVVSRDILHKTEAGGVRLHLSGEVAAGEAIAEMATRIGSGGQHIDGWLLEEMAPAGVEMAVGGTIDGRFGPVVMAGFGGILIELLRDIAFAICPIDQTDADEMLSSLHGHALLDGWRGSQPANLGALRDALLCIGGRGGLLDTLNAEVAELDINPLIVSPAGAVAADARILLGPGG